MSKKHSTSISVDLEKSLGFSKESDVLFTGKEAILCIVGATASGKSALAVEIAKSYQAEIISVDSSQVYRSLDIGTGKITVQEMDGVPHHLIDVVDLNQGFDAGLFCEKADECIQKIWQKNKRVILCGGTGLYFKALFYGLCATPQVDLQITQSLRDQIEKGELYSLYEQLKQVDPIMAMKLNPEDKQRIERALSVYLSTQKPLSAWQDEQIKQQRYQGLFLGIHWERELLNQRIQQRIDLMFKQGFVQEVESLLAKGDIDQLQALSAIGYRLVAQALAESQGDPKQREFLSMLPSKKLKDYSEKAGADVKKA